MTPTIPILPAIAHIWLWQGRTLSPASVTPPPYHRSTGKYSVSNLCHFPRLNSSWCHRSGPFLFQPRLWGDVYQRVVVVPHFIPVYCCFCVPHPEVPPFLRLYIYHPFRYSSTPSLCSQNLYIHCPASLPPYPSSPRSSLKFISHGPSFLPYLQYHFFCRSLVSTTIIIIFSAVSSDIVPIIMHLLRPPFHIIYCRVQFSRISNVIIIIRTAIFPSWLSTLLPYKIWVYHICCCALGSDWLSSLSSALYFSPLDILFFPQTTYH